MTLLGGTVAFTTTHFSQYQVGINPAAWQLLYNPPGTAAYTGAGTYQYPITVPPGIGGLTPSLGLSYNSRPVDSVKVPAMASGLGLGWSLSEMEIVNENPAGMYKLTPSSPEGEAFDKNKFTLVLDGVSYRLQPHPGVSRHGRYQALGGPALRIEYKNDDGDNVTGEYWQVRTVDGTTYTFGDTPGAEQVVGAVSSTQNVGQPRNNGLAAVSWKLSRITDVYGREIIYWYTWKYARNSNDTADRTHGGFPIEADTAVSQIRYNFVNGNPQTIIHFYYAERNSGDGRARSQVNFMTAGILRPTKIEIMQGTTTIGRYDFTYFDLLDDPQHPGVQDLGEHWISAWEATCCKCRRRMPRITAGPPSRSRRCARPT